MGMPGFVVDFLSTLYLLRISADEEEQSANGLRSGRMIQELGHNTMRQEHNH
jgi:hypothetical protein